MTRLVVSIAAIAAMSLSGSAVAQQSDYSGRWLLSGLIMAGRGAFSFAQICDLKQEGTQVAGLCRGPNGSCSAVGVAESTQIDLTCRNTSTGGVLTFHGELDGNGIARGICSNTRVPGAEGKASMMRV